VRQRREVAERLTGPALADRDLPAGVPPIGLGHLAGQVGGALVGASGEEERADLPEVVLQDGAAAGVALPAQMFQDDRGRNLGVLIQHGRHGVLERFHERRRRCSSVLRRLRQPEQTGDGVAAHLQAPCDLRLGKALAMQTMNVGPIVH
jgi:hypothetical protein